MTDPARDGGTSLRARRASTLWPWALTVGWLLLCALGYFGLAGGEADLDPLRVMMIPVSVFGPIVMVWFGWVLVGLQRETRAEVAALRGAVERAVGGAPTPDPRESDEARSRAEARPVQTSDPARPSGTPDAAAPARSAQRTTTPVEPASDLPPATAPDAPSDPEPVEALSTEDLILALHFPADADDADGFRALRRAMEDDAIKPVVTAAQDVLTLLSQERIYMDDLSPEPSTPDTWREFAGGSRSTPIEADGDPQSPETIGLVREKLDGDPVFADTAAHFARGFERLLAEIEPSLTDADLIALSETRTGQAFMVLSRATTPTEKA